MLFACWQQAAAKKASAAAAKKSARVAAERKEAKKEASETKKRRSMITIILIILVAIIGVMGYFMDWWAPIISFFTNIFNPKKTTEETIVNQQPALEKQQAEAIDAKKTLAIKQQALANASVMAGGKRKTHKKFKSF